MGLLNPVDGDQKYWLPPDAKIVADLKAQSISFDLLALITGAGTTVSKVVKILSKPHRLSETSKVYNVV